jgi:hypothetical protein
MFDLVKVAESIIENRLLSLCHLCRSRHWGWTRHECRTGLLRWDRSLLMQILRLSLGLKLAGSAKQTAADRRARAVVLNGASTSIG